MDPKHNAPNQPVTGSSLIPAFGPKNLEKKSGMVDFSLTEVEDPDDDDDYDTFDAHSACYRSWGTATDQKVTFEPI